MDYFFISGQFLFPVVFLLIHYGKLLGKNSVWNTEENFLRLKRKFHFSFLILFLAAMLPIADYYFFELPVFEDFGQILKYISIFGLKISLIGMIAFYFVLEKSQQRKHHSRLILGKIGTISDLLVFLFLLSGFLYSGGIMPLILCFVFSVYSFFSLYKFFDLIKQ